MYKKETSGLHSFWDYTTQSFIMYFVNPLTTGHTISPKQAKSLLTR